MVVQSSDSQDDSSSSSSQQKEAAVNNTTNKKKVDDSFSSSAEENSSDNDEESKEDEDEESRRRSSKDEKVSEPKDDSNAVMFNLDIAKTQSSSNSKRPVEEENQGRKKKMKAGVTGDSQGSKFEQKFTDNDELVIMKGYVDFNFKHKRLARHREFTDFIKPLISFPVTKKQISEKILRVRNKYTNAIKGGKKKNTPHDLEVFKLCENVWGDKNQSTYNKERGIKKHEVEVEENSKIFTNANDYLNNIMAIGGGGGSGISHIDLGVFDERKRDYFAKKLKALMVKEFELYSKKAELVTAIVEKLKSKQREATILMKGEIGKVS